MMVDTLIIGSGVAATIINEALLVTDPNASILMLEAGTREDQGLRFLGGLRLGTSCRTRHIVARQSG